VKIMKVLNFFMYPPHLLLVIIVKISSSCVSQPTIDYMYWTFFWKSKCKFI